MRVERRGTKWYIKMPDFKVWAELDERPTQDTLDELQVLNNRVIEKLKKMKRGDTVSPASDGQWEEVDWDG